MRYIVWRTPFKSYDYPQGDGYFVKWKNKCADEWSNKWFEANKYKNIGPAIDRLGLELNATMKTMDDFFEANPLSKSIKRDRIISNLFGEESSRNYMVFDRGHIDKIDDDGNFIGNAGEELINFVEEYIKKNIKKNESLKKKFESIGLDSYIDKSTSDDEFWSEILK